MRAEHENSIYFCRGHAVDDGFGRADYRAVQYGG